jgi:hypothetical protein
VKVIPRYSKQVSGNIQSSLSIMNASSTRWSVLIRF